MLCSYFYQSYLINLFFRLAFQLYILFTPLCNDEVWPSKFYCFIRENRKEIRCSYPGAADFLQLESIPDSIPSILKSLSIAAILRSQIPDPLPGPREKDPVTDITLRLPLFQQLIEIDDAGIVAGEVVFDMLEEIVAVERADQTGAGFAVKAPSLQIVLIAVLALPAHVN